MRGFHRDPVTLRESQIHWVGACFALWMLWSARLSHDSLGRITKYVYNGLNQITSATDAVGKQTLSATTRMGICCLSPMRTTTNTVQYDTWTEFKPAKTRC